MDLFHTSPEREHAHEIHAVRMDAQQQTEDTRITAQGCPVASAYRSQVLPATRAASANRSSPKSRSTPTEQVCKQIESAVILG
jgi:hypothetical protein